uniref:Uncharacterized protein n=1 Tax=Arundo donax TaxID=35708 RepID=A0A0A8Y3K8_ARUDO
MATTQYDGTKLAWFCHINWPHLFAICAPYKFRHTRTLDNLQLHAR